MEILSKNVTVLDLSDLWQQKNLIHCLFTFLQLVSAMKSKRQWIPFLSPNPCTYMKIV